MALVAASPGSRRSLLREPPSFGRGPSGPALLSALLLVAAFPPFHLMVPSFLALVPFAVWVARLDGGVEGRRTATRGGVLFGAVYYAVLLYWIVPALAWVTDLAVPAFLAMVGLLAALAGGFGWGLHRAVHGAGAPLWLALPVAWTAMEWARAHLPGGLGFPWLELGTSLTGFPELVGIAELVGTRGVSFWLAGVNGLLAAALVRGRTARRGAAGRGGAGHLLVAAALLALLPAAWGLWRAATLETRVVARVAILQPNIPADVKRDPVVALERTSAALDRLVARLVTAGEAGAGPPPALDLVALPEGAFPFALTAPEATMAAEALAGHARALGAPLVVGAYGAVDSVDAPVTEAPRSNSVFIVDPRGPRPGRYDKRRLVPFVERDAWLFPVAPLGRFRAGPGAGEPPLRAGGIPLGILICWEAAFQEDARRHRLAGAEILLNVTNDAWYGGASGRGRTTALLQHPAHLVMRAIETRTGAVRAANTGVSFFVDPVGRTYGTLAVSAEEAGVADVRTSDIITLHARLGDVVGRGSAAAAVLLVLWGFGGAPARRTMGR